MQRRILLLITDLQIGGTPTVIRELATRLKADPEVYVHVACLDRSGPVADQLRDRGVPVTTLDARGRTDIRVFPRLINLITQEKIDTVFSFLIHANAVAAQASLFTANFRFFQSIQTTQPDPQWHWTLQKMIQSRAEAIVVPSLSVAQAARQWAGIDSQKIIVIPNAVEIADFQITPEPGTGKRIGFIGRLDPIKRIEDLVTAISLLKGDFILDIYGQGSERDQIQSTIDWLALQTRVSLRGQIKSSPEALKKLDILVLPSDAEGFGLVLIEAMAAGVPVVGTNVLGIRDVIEDGVSGLLVPPKNPQALASAIEQITNDPALKEKLIAGGRERVRSHYDWSVVIRQYRELLLGHP